MTPEESRLIAVERRLFRLGEEARALRREAAGIGQGLLDLWRDDRIPQVLRIGVPACPSHPFPTTLYMRDFYVPATAMPWDASAEVWACCHLIPSSAAITIIDPTCATATGVASAVVYQLDRNLVLTRQFEKCTGVWNGFMRENACPGSLTGSSLFGANTVTKTGGPTGTTCGPPAVLNYATTWGLPGGFFSGLSITEAP